MQAVILAGGLGTRLWPLTQSVPKPMVRVAGVPYLEHQVRVLKKQDVRDIVVLTGYLGEQIEAYFGDGRQAKSYLLSDECVAAMLFAVEHAKEPLNIYNLGCDDWLQVTTIADMVVSAMGLRDVAYQFTGGEGGWPGDVPRFRLDVSAINRLGWKAELNSAQAVERAIESTLRECKP